jgi:DNA-binding transcriptional ArsR family regulator
LIRTVWKAYSEEAADLLAAMGNQKRMMILCNLANGEMQVGTLAEKVDLSQSALSQHLAKLRTRQLVKTRREAQAVYYSINSDSGLADAPDTDSDLLQLTSRA